jgi:hypothetical protein
MRLLKLQLINIFLFIVIKLILFSENLSTRSNATRQQFNVNFRISNSNSNQTIFLFNKTELTKTVQKLTIVSAKPADGAKLFSLGQTTNDDAVLLTLNAPQSTQLHSNYFLQLNSNSLSINVTIYNENGDLLQATRKPARHTIDYILKLFNDSSYGLIKNDMSVVVVAIVRLLANQTILFNKSKSNYFEVKTITSNYYMVKLTPQIRDLFKANSVNSEIELVLETTSLDELIRLKFKVVDRSDLAIKIKPKNFIKVNLPELKNRAEYGNQFLYKAEPQLAVEIFSNKPTDLDRYKKQFLRYTVTNTSAQLDKSLIEIDDETGIFSLKYIPNKLVQNFWLNITVQDANKNLFRSNYVFVFFSVEKSYSSSFKYDHIIEISNTSLQSFPFSSNRYLILNQSSSVMNQACDISIYRASKLESLFSLDKSRNLWMAKSIFYHLSKIDFVHIELASTANNSICERLSFLFKVTNTFTAPIPDSSRLITSTVFDKSYKFKLNENEFNKSIGQFETASRGDCNSSSCILVEFQINSLRADLAEKVKISFLNDTKFDLFITEPVDYELDQAIEFSVSSIYKSASQGQVFLFKTRVVISIVDSNDNKPRFLSPFIKNQLINKELDLTDQEESKFFLMKVEASDLDASVKCSKLKFALVETVCYLEQCDFSINLNEFSGDLFLIKKSNMTSQVSNFYDFGLKVRVYNYMDLLNPNYVTTRFRITAKLKKTIQFIDAIGGKIIRLNSSKFIILYYSYF